MRLNKHLAVILVFSFHHSLVFAAVAEKTQNSAVLIQDILNLPSQNRAHIASQQGLRFYQELIQVSFSEKQPMSSRWKALTLAAQVGQKKSLPELQKASGHSAWFMRNAALLAMYEVDKEAAYDLAKVLIKDKALVVRSAAVDVLAKYNKPAVRDLFWEEVYQDYNKKKNQSLWIRGQILNHLSRSPEAHERSLFFSLLKDKSLDVQKESVRALEKITGRVLGGQEISWSKKISLWQSESVKK
jgi:hypothetical protein